MIRGVTLRRISAIVLAGVLVVAFAGAALAQVEQPVEKPKRMPDPVRQEFRGELKALKGLHEQLQNLREQYREERKEYHGLLREAWKNRDENHDAIVKSLDLIKESLHVIAQVKDAGDTNAELRVEIVKARLDGNFDEAVELVREIKANLEKKIDLAKQAIAYVEQAQEALR